MSKLVVVPTPIGNLGDMTYRAVQVLQEAGLIYAEDTRTSGRLLAHYGVKTQMKAYHMFNEHKQVERFVEEIQAYETVALISDAGTPGISDPGFLLVRECIEAGIEIECLPGATAMIPAIVSSGLPNDRFVFEGFLPHKKGRVKRIEALTEETRTIVFYESPHRILKTLKQLGEILGTERRACVGRELSKLHEEILRGSLEELAIHFEKHAPKGEIVLVVEGKTV
jgi:16S rRNA (cytidine1402-2'-O)-methyltransferase